jgi:hypothetical protein
VSIGEIKKQSRNRDHRSKKPMDRPRVFRIVITLILFGLGIVLMLNGLCIAYTPNIIEEQKNISSNATIGPKSSPTPSFVGEASVLIFFSILLALLALTVIYYKLTKKHGEKKDEKT